MISWLKQWKTTTLQKFWLTLQQKTSSDSAHFIADINFDATPSSSEVPKTHLTFSKLKNALEGLSSERQCRDKEHVALALDAHAGSGDAEVREVASSRRADTLHSAAWRRHPFHPALRCELMVDS